MFLLMYLIQEKQMHFKLIKIMFKHITETFDESFPLSSIYRCN